MSDQPIKKVKFEDLDGALPSITSAISQICFASVLATSKLEAACTAMDKFFEGETYKKFVAKNAVLVEVNTRYTSKERASIPFSRIPEIVKSAREVMSILAADETVYFPKNAPAVDNSEIDKKVDALLS